MINYLLPPIREKLKSKRLIFTISTGRCGTGFLANILNTLPGVAGVHEPFPKFSDVMRYCQIEPNLALGFWTCSKFPAITYFNQPIYVETSHLFAKGFIEPLLTLGIRPDVIFLHRPARNVALSLYQLNTIPARTRLGLKFLLSPTDRGVARLHNWENLHDYQLCYWYCLEMERRSRVYENFCILNNWHFSKISLAELKTVDSLINFLFSFDLLHSSSSADSVKLLYDGNNIFNAKQEMKQKISKNIDLDFDKMEEIVRNNFDAENIVT